MSDWMRVCNCVLGGKGRIEVSETFIGEGAVVSGRVVRVMIELAWRGLVQKSIEHPGPRAVCARSGPGHAA